MPDSQTILHNPADKSDWTNAGDAMLVSGALDELASRVTIGNATVGVTFDGGGSPIEASSQYEVASPFAWTITGWTLLADQSGSITVDVWKDTGGNYPPTNADTITAGAEPALSTDNYATGGVSGWTTAVASGDVLKFNVDSITTIQRATLLLTGTRP